MWTCPKCSATVDGGFDVCWQCGTSREGVEDPSFVSADDAGPIEGDTGGEVEPGSANALKGPGGIGAELVPCYQAFSLIEAKFLSDQLVEAGIQAVSDGFDMQDAIGGWSGNPRVYCHEKDLDRARAFLAEYERKKAGHDPVEP